MAVGAGEDRAVLVGRDAECGAVERLLAEARHGRSAALVLSGEAGVGKTAVLQHVRAAAARSGFRLVDAVGVESEAEFAFAGVHQLCAPLLERAGRLPEPQPPSGTRRAVLVAH